MNIETRYDEPTSTLTYVVFDEKTKDAVVIDPVLDYNPLGSQTDVASAVSLAQWIEERGLNVHYILETHAHADHLSAAQYLKERLGAKIVIGENIREVQGVFKKIFDLGDDFATDGSQFDLLVKEGEPFNAGTLTINVYHTPGHTPACVSYLIGDALFTGDALFMPDGGTGRCDFPGGSADQMYNSIHDKLYGLPDETRVFVGHDYQPQGRAVAYETTIGESKRANVQLKAATTRDDFVKFRTERDKTLASPRLLFQSVQVNVDAGRLPKSEGGHPRYLKLPLNLFKPTNECGEPVKS